MYSEFLIWHLLMIGNYLDLVQGSVGLTYVVCSTPYQEYTRTPELLRQQVRRGRNSQGTDQIIANLFLIVMSITLLMSCPPDQLPPRYSRSPL